MVATPVEFLVANIHYSAVKAFLDEGLYKVPKGCEIKEVSGNLTQVCDPPTAR